MSDEDLVKRLVRFEGKTCVSSDDEVLAAYAIERLTRERDEARNTERERWIQALLSVLPEEKAVLFRDICIAREAQEDSHE